MHYRKFSFALVLLFTCFSVQAAEGEGSAYPSLRAEHTDWIGQQIFNNECNLQISCLTSWNAGESFPSLGIGHFIWFQSGQVEPFQQSFPDLIHFLEAQAIAIPAWIVAADYASPWENREDFLHDFELPRLIELRQFLQAQQPA